GTTVELAQVVRDALSGKKPPPDPNPKEEPGLGPELPRDAAVPHSSGAKRLGSGGRIFAVIPTFVVVGPLAVLAALFPAVFGGLMLVLRRWTVLLSVASLDSTLFLAHGWLHKYWKDSWWGTSAALWCALGLVAVIGAALSWRRAWQALPEERAASLR